MQRKSSDSHAGTSGLCIHASDSGHHWPDVKFLGNIFKKAELV